MGDAGKRSIRIPVVRLPGSEDLPLPAYMTAGSAGADLHAANAEPLVVAPGDVRAVPTGLKLAIPPGYEGQVRPRSGLALRGLTIVNAPGTIDSDYRGEVKVVVGCLGREAIEIRRGDRIAQIVIAPVATASFEAAGDLEATARHDGGFGHTGVRAGRDGATGA